MDKNLWKNDEDTLSTEEELNTVPKNARLIDDPYVDPLTAVKTITICDFFNYCYYLKLIVVDLELKYYLVMRYFDSVSRYQEAVYKQQNQHCVLFCFFFFHFCFILWIHLVSMVNFCRISSMEDYFISDNWFRMYLMLLTFQ